MPLRVALMNDHEVVVHGLLSMLGEYADRVVVVELDCQLPVVAEIDVLLYDAFGREQVGGRFVQVLEETSAPVVIYTWRLDPSLVRECLALGAGGVVSKTVPAEELVEALEKVHAGSVVVSPDPGPDAALIGGDWPGRQQGLTVRESEVVALIAVGLSNQEVADRAFLSINSVKTHIRSAYRKMGVQRRSQAVLWATRNGFLPDVVRTVLPAGPAHGVTGVTGGRSAPAPVGSRRSPGPRSPRRRSG